MDKAEQIVDGLGGAANIEDVEACITRLRVDVADGGLVDAIQVVVGPEADNLVDDIEDLLD